MNQFNEVNEEVSRKRELIRNALTETFDKWSRFL
ncbi:hypothetical protein Mic7113_4489 [Allocoleopsis franciscana PCC 7113]|uniref:Uncharacterized protein n=1 Tax=Allocoleopsis franciscana PCC 7113 TaxID=1173027 RepID=K9WJ21_9CYAN|nr:hypothetical protein Mic7113_4489 [Allocoleopsis franciscana PCC 7113]